MEALAVLCFCNKRLMQKTMSGSMHCSQYPLVAGGSGAQQGFAKTIVATTLKRPQDHAGLKIDMFTMRGGGREGGEGGGGGGGRGCSLDSPGDMNSAGRSLMVQSSARLCEKTVFSPSNDDTLKSIHMRCGQAHLGISGMQMIGIKALQVSTILLQVAKVSGMLTCAYAIMRIAIWHLLVSSPDGEFHRMKLHSDITELQHTL